VTTLTSSLATWLKARPIAHRGLHDVSQGVVENTKTAFARAIDGNFAIECDLQISADDEAMVFHDPGLGRLTGEKELVSALTCAQLKQVKFKSCDDEMQTLKELLDQVDGRVPLVIELKSLVDGNLALVERAIEVLAGYTGPYALMSFAPLMMRAVKDLSPETPRGAVISPATENLWLPDAKGNDQPTNGLREVEPDFVSYSVKGLPSELVNNFRSDTKPVICWTVKDQKTADFSYKYCDQITFEGFDPG